MVLAHPHMDELNVDLRGARDADFLAIGLGATNLMSALFALASGRRVVGVEMRGDPFLGVHWNIRENVYHQFGLIDEMMLWTYGEAGVPRSPVNNKPFRLADKFFSTHTVSGEVTADEIIDGYDNALHLVGTIQHIEFIDDRYRNGIPNRVVTNVAPPPLPTHPDWRKIRTNTKAVLDGPSTYQAEARSILLLMQRYLEAIEQMDLEAGRETPRVRLFTHHRVAPGDQGFIRLPDGRIRIQIETLQEFDYQGRFLRVRLPGSPIIDLGVPKLFVIAEGYHSTDAERLGFQQHDVAVDHGDGRGSVVAQADFVAVDMMLRIDGRLRRRISSTFGPDGCEYWLRQIAVGHENAPEIAWVLVQVPDYKVFDPVAEGMLPEGTESNSPEFVAAYRHILYDFFLEQAAGILELSVHELRHVTVLYGPKLFSLVERVGDDPRIAVNGVIAGDSFGNGHFLTSGGAMTGMCGHATRVLEYWQTLSRGVQPEEAIVQLAAGIKADTDAWLAVSAPEFSEAVPSNFGAERGEKVIAASGIDPAVRAKLLEANRRERHSLIPLDPSDWRRLVFRNGRIRTMPLPEISPLHPDLRVPPDSGADLGGNAIPLQRTGEVAVRVTEQDGAPLA